MQNKIKLFSLLAVSAMLFACGGGETSSEETSINNTSSEIASSEIVSEEESENSTGLVSESENSTGLVSESENSTGLVSESESSSEEDISSVVEEPDDYVTDVQVEKAYKLMINQKGVGKKLYYAGGYNGYYGASTQNESEGIDVVLKETTGGYYIGYLDGTTSTFINAVQNGTYNNIKFETTPTSVWTFNTEYYTLTTTCGENTVYIGTYGTYETFSLSKISYIETSYPARLYVSTSETPNVTIPTTGGDTGGDIGGDIGGETDGNTSEGTSEGTGEVDANKIELTTTSLNLPSNQYSDGEATVNSVTFTYVQLANYGNGIQVRDNAEKSSTSVFYNTTAFEKGIEKIELTFNSSKATHDNTDAEIFSFANDSFANSTTVVSYEAKLSTSATSKTYTITPDVNTYTFMRFEHDVSYTFYWDSIVIYLVD